MKTDGGAKNQHRWSCALALAAGLGGCRPCDDLDERICSDLGPQDCQVWTEKLNKVGSASTSPTRFGRRTWIRAVFMGPNGQACSTQLDMYDETLAAIRTAVQGQKTADAAVAAARQAP